MSVLHAALVRDFKEGGVAVDPPAPKAGLDGVDKFRNIVTILESP